MYKPGLVAETDRGIVDTVERLTASNDCTGADVYDRQSVHLGNVHNFMVDCATGRAAYVIISLGDDFGACRSYQSLPWQMIDYDYRRDRYIVDLDRGALARAPCYTAADWPNWADPSYGDQVDAFFGTPPFSA